MIKEELLEELKNLDESFPKFCELARTVIDDNPLEQEEVNLHNIINALNEVRRNIDGKRDRIYEEIHAIKESANYSNLPSKQAKLYDAQIAKVLNDTWNDVCRAYGEAFEIFLEPQMECIIDIFHKIDSTKNTEYRGTVRQVMSKIRHIDNNNSGRDQDRLIEIDDSERDELRDRIIKWGTTFIADEMKWHADSKIVRKLTEPIFTTKEGVAGILQSLKKIPNAAVSKLSSKKAIVHRNLSSHKMNIIAEGTKINISKTNKVGVYTRF